MKRFNLGRGRVEEQPAPAERADEPPWKSRALDATGLWLRVDESLRVRDISLEAAELFGHPVLPASLVTVTRSAAAEALARRAREGETGPWEFEATHFKRVLRMSAVDLAEDGTVLFLQDITELQRLQAMRADFVANLAHELRTPVASLSLAAETLTTDLPPHQQRRFIERIAEETRYIEGLLRSVSELALLESEVQLSLSVFPVRELVDETWRRVADRLGTQPVDNRVAADVRVCADRVRIAEVMQNLLENAHRFSPPGRATLVDARICEDGSTEVSVTDRGPGIPPAELPRVFERFYKVDRARTRRGEGSGLGLAISKHLVSAHGGRIWATLPDDGGTRITFVIPEPPEATG